MSRVAKNPVTVPAGVEVKFGTDALVIKGKNGELSFPLHSDVAIELNDGKLTFAAKNDSKQANAMSGTARALVNNMVKGVSEGFEKKLEVNGVGYRLSGGGQNLEMHLGFSHPIKYTAPAGIDIKVEKMNITVSGIDKQLVGQVAADIRAFKKPEPYKGKGIKYADETIIRKVGKAGK